MNTLSTRLARLEALHPKPEPPVYYFNERAGAFYQVVIPSVCDDYRQLIIAMGVGIHETPADASVYTAADVVQLQASGAQVHVTHYADVARAWAHEQIT